MQQSISLESRMVTVLTHKQHVLYYSHNTKNCWGCTDINMERSKAFFNLRIT